MKKRKNIIISAITCMMSICLLMFGVYAASNPSVSISGQVSYTARDASVLVQGKADETGAGISASNFLAVPATKDFSSLTKVTSGKSYLDWTKGETSNDDTDNFSNWTDLDLNFVEDSNGVKDITIGFYMTNYSNYPVKATITVKKDITNVTISDKNQVVLLDTYKQNPTSKLAKITLSLDNDSVSVNAQELGINVVFEKYDLTPTNSKLDFAYATGNSATISGGYYTASIKSDAEGEIVYPATYDDGTNGELPVAPNGFNTIANAMGYIQNGYTSVDAIYSQKNEKITSVVVSEGITELQIGAFAVLTNLENVILPSTLKYIGAAALAFCDSLTQISLPDELETIDTYQVGTDYAGAFMYSQNLSSITIPKNIQIIKEGTFQNCTNLETLIFAEGSKCTKIGENAFDFCAMENVVLPEGMTTLDEWAFLYCNNLISLTIPSTMTTIDSTSLRCYRLSEVINKSSLAEIDNNVVRNATSGESKIEKYGDYRYIVGDDGITYLIGYFGKSKNISLPTDRTYAIKDMAFVDCRLKSLSIPNNVTSIGETIFYDTDAEYENEITTLTIPESVTDIAEAAFYECVNLTSISIPNSVTTIKSRTFYGCTALKNENNLYGNAYYIGNSSNPYLILLSAKNTDITECEINSNTKFIYDDAFNGCNSLTSITIPDNVIEINQNIFYNCTNLKTVTVNAETPPRAFSLFNNSSTLTAIYVPAGSVEAYKAAAGWSEFADMIQAMA